MCLIYKNLVLLVMAAVLLVSGVGVAQAKLVCEVAQPFIRPEGAPAASDVTMRSLKFRPMNKNDPHDTFESLKTFHATRLEWVYLRFTEEEKAKIAKVKQMGRVFGGAGSGMSGLVNDMVRDENGKFTKKHCITDLDGHAIIHGHKKHWANPKSSGCMNDPFYATRHIDYYKKYIDYGAETLQRDEPSQNHAFSRNGGCFCDICVEQFNKYLFENTSANQLKKMGIADLWDFDYGDYLRERGESKYDDDFDWSNPASFRKLTGGDELSQLFVKFQEESNTRFFQRLKRSLAIHAGRMIPVSCNNTSFQRWNAPYYTIFDFCMSEMMMKSANPQHIYDRSNMATSLGKVQVFGTPKTMGKSYPADFLVQLKRNVISTTYATGSLSRVPWDIFEQTKDGSGRYFGKVEKFADIYGFVRANDKYLADYCEAGGFGRDIAEDRYGSDQPVVVDDSSGELYAFLRAKPDDKDAAVVVHLVLLALGHHV